MPDDKRRGGWRMLSLEARLVGLGPGRLVLLGGVLAGVLLLLSACRAPAETPSPVYLEAAGATAMLPLMEDLTAAFSQRHPQVSLDVSGGGSTLGQEMAAAGQVDLGLTCWLPDGPPPGLRATIIARDGISVIVHPTNAITGLTLINVRGIFSGRITDWRQLGGQSIPVQVISREDGSGTRAVFESQCMQGRRVTPMALVMPNSQAVVDYVAGDPQAVGYVSMGYDTAGTRIITLEEMLPTPENVSNGAYFLTQELVVLTRSDGPAEVRAFLDFALSPAGQSIVGRRYGRVR